MAKDGNLEGDGGHPIQNHYFIGSNLFSTNPWSTIFYVRPGQVWDQHFVLEPNFFSHLRGYRALCLFSYLRELCQNWIFFKMDFGARRLPGTKIGTLPTRPLF